MCPAAWPTFFLGFSSNSEIAKVLYSPHSFPNTSSSIPSAQQRKLLAAAAAAGVSVAFGSPLGGVLFGLEGKVALEDWINRHLTASRRA